ncbi:MAG: L-threonine O-3-phosphate decarboxylase, partial [Cellvibrionales bacterium]
DRDLFYQDLCSIEGLIVYKPDANYIFCRLPDHAPSGPAVAKTLFVDHNMYIKHCEGKSMPESDRYVRIASRTQDENKQLVKVLDKILAPDCL